MADENLPPGNEPRIPEAEKQPVRRKPRRRSLDLAKETLADIITKDYESDSNDRNDLIRSRMERYAKLMGWLPDKDWPWSDCSNMWVPLMLWSMLRMEATLENAVKSVRPLMKSKAWRRGDMQKEDRLDKLLDYQVFVENKGEAKIDGFISNFVQDEAVFAFVHWVKQQEAIYDVRVKPGLNLTSDHIPQILKMIPEFFPENSIIPGYPVMKDNDGWVWEVQYLDMEGETIPARIEFGERDDGKLEVHIAWRGITHNGPIFDVMDFEDLLFPTRAGNLQPPTAFNVYGAEHVIQIGKGTVDTIQRLVDDKFYDLVDEDDMQAIKNVGNAVAKGDPEEQPKEQKDKLSGQVVTKDSGGTERKILRWFGAYDIDGDGLNEEIIVRMEKDSKKILKVTPLTEEYPGVPLMRPFANTSFYPITNRVLGMSFLQALEPIQDAMKTLMDQHIDWGSITNAPFFTYRASSGMKPEPIYVEPGMGYPLDNPQTDIFFPQWPTKDSSYNLNTMMVLQQFAERIAMESDASYGRVPAGKASALRTLGTTLSLLSQGDKRSEQVLRRLFYGFSQLYTLIHRLNRRYLPDSKEFRVIGEVEAGQDAYANVKNDEVDFDADFEFKATLLNANKQAVAEALQQIAAVLVSPIAIQLGIVTPEKVSNLFRDMIKAVDQDPERYTVRPPNDDQPKLTAEDAITTIMQGQMPQGVPLEAPMEHYQKVMVFAQTDAGKHLSTIQLGLLQAWIQTVQRAAMQDMQKQMMMQAAAASQQQIGGGQPAGPGGAPTTFPAPGGVGANAPVEANQPMAGAGQGTGGNGGMMQ